MEVYVAFFALLVFCNAALAWHQRQKTKDVGTGAGASLALPPGKDGKKKAWHFKLKYFACYVLVMASDWLQGPYMYTVYKDEKALPESTVAGLFTTGFICAGISASFVGSLADKYGRRTGCLVFCLASSLSCSSVLSDDRRMLFLGKALGGLATTLLYSVFETWMIAEYHAQDLSASLPLEDMFSTSVTLSGAVAIVAGIVGETVVRQTGTKKAPFMVATLCLGLAAVGMLKYWGENRGESTGSEQGSSYSELRTKLLGRRILALTLATTIFEGSMYLFVYFWSPALQTFRDVPGTVAGMPFGLIFSCFMSAMMSGSMVPTATGLRSDGDTGWLLLSVLSLAANSLLLPVISRAEVVTFWSFALFEMCVGLYYPTMSRLKSELIEDSVRGRMYGWMRLPLNVLIVLALGITREGNGHREMMFTVIGSMLLAAFVVVQRNLL